MPRKPTGMKRQHFYLPISLLTKMTRRAEWSGITASELVRKYLEIGMDSENHKFKQYEANLSAPGSLKDPLLQKSQDLADTTGKATSLEQ